MTEHGSLFFLEETEDGAREKAETLKKDGYRPRIIKPVKKGDKWAIYGKVVSRISMSRVEKKAEEPSEKDLLEIDTD